MAKDKYVHDDGGIHARECAECGDPVDLRTCVIAADRTPYCSNACRGEREDAYDNWVTGGNDPDGPG